MDTQTLLLAVHSLTDTAELEAVMSAARDRKQTLANVNAATVSIGDQATFSDLIRPKYLVGLPVTITKKNGKSVVVSCPDDPRYGRFQGLKNVRCPNELIAA